MSRRSFSEGGLLTHHVYILESGVVPVHLYAGVTFDLDRRLETAIDTVPSYLARRRFVSRWLKARR